MVKRSRLLVIAIGCSSLHLRHNIANAFVISGGGACGSFVHAVGLSLLSNSNVEPSHHPSSSAPSSSLRSCYSIASSSTLYTCNGDNVIATSLYRSSGVLPSSLHRRQAVALNAKKRRRRRRVDETATEGAEAAAALVDGAKQDDEEEGETEEEEVIVEEIEEDDDDEEEEVDQPPARSVLASGIMMPPTASDLGIVIENDNPFDMLKLDPDYSLLGRDLKPGEALGSGSAGMTVSQMKAKAKKGKYYSFGLEVPLPVESETIGDGGFVDPLADKPSPLGLNGGGGGKGKGSGSMPLPDLKDVALAKDKKREEDERKANRKKISRSDREAYVKLLELDPEADSEMGAFEDERYDLMASVLGEGSAPFLGVPNGFIQSGHTVLLALCLLCAFVYYPGFPLTELPYDIRMFIQKGLLVTYVINLPIAALAFKLAGEKKQPAFFWAFKTFILGGLSYNELSQVKVFEEEPKPSRRRRS